MDNTAETSGNKNITLQEISDSQITITVNNVTERIGIDFTELKTLLDKNGCTTFFAGDNKTYNIDNINNANFNDVIESCKNVLKNVSIGKVEGNMHIGDIVFNNNNNLEDIFQFISNWHEKQSRQYLFIVVVAETREKVENESDLKAITNQYGFEPHDWKPFINLENEPETILDILNEFKNLTRIDFKLFVTDGLDFSQRKHKVRFKDKIVPNIIVITDALAINPRNRDLLSLVNEKTDKSGFLWLVEQKYSEDIKGYIKSKFEDTLGDTHSRFYEQLETACINLELEIPSKKLFFRRLTNIASTFGITAKANMSALEEKYYMDSLNSISPNGFQDNQ